MKIKEILATALLAVTVQMLPAVNMSAQKYEGIVDKTVALVGNNVVLLSQVESAAIYMQGMGYVSDRNLRCEALENIMVTKLFYTQAVLDSLAVNPDMVNAMLEQKVDDVLTKLGGEKATEAFFQKPLHVLREEWRSEILEQSLAGEMRRTIAGKVMDVTPKEVQHFIESQTEIQVVQIIGRVLVLFKVSANKDARELSSRVKKI